METAYKEGLKRDEELKKIKENLVSCFACLFVLRNHLHC